MLADRPDVAAAPEALGSTRNGVTKFSPNLERSGLKARVQAHESIHRAQFAARSTGLPVGTRTELEAEAVDGTEAILQARQHKVQFAAPAGMELHYPAWLPDPERSGTRELDSIQSLSPRQSDTPDVRAKTHEKTGGGADAVESFGFEVSTAAEGSRGTISTTTRIQVISDPGDPMVSVLTTSTDPTRELGPPVDVPAYPVRILYTRNITYSDSNGRNVVVSINGNVHFTRASWEQALVGRTPSFEALQGLVGDSGSAHMLMDGQGPLPDFAYLRRVRSGANSVRAQLDQAAQGLAPGRHTGFVSISTTAGEQFAALERYLFEADQAEIKRRRQEMIDSLHAESDSESWLDSLASWLGNKVSEAWNLIPAPVRGILKGLGKAVAAVATVIVAAVVIVLLAPFEVAVATVATVLGVGLLFVSFVSSLFSRSEEAQATGEGGMFAIVGAALADTFGISGIYEGYSDKSILSGEDLGRSEVDRWEGGTLGFIQVLASFIGIRASYKGSPVPARGVSAPRPGVARPEAAIPGPAGPPTLRVIPGEGAGRGAQPGLRTSGNLALRQLPEYVPEPIAPPLRLVPSQPAPAAVQAPALARPSGGTQLSSAATTAAGAAAAVQQANRSREDDENKTPVHFYHGTDESTADAMGFGLLVSPSGKGEFGGGFYTFLEEGPAVAVAQKYTRTRGLPRWGVVDFDVPAETLVRYMGIGVLVDQANLSNILFFPDRSTPMEVVYPDNVSPGLVRQMNWEEFRDENTRIRRQMQINAHWPYDAIIGPLSGRLRGFPRNVTQVKLDGLGVSMLNHGSVNRSIANRGVT